MTEQDKQALIKHFCFRDCGEAAKDCMIMPCHEIELIQEFPTTDTDSDTISRKAAIDALRAMQTYKLFAGDDMLLIDQAGAQTELMMLPPAQPESDSGRWERHYSRPGVYADLYWHCSKCGYKTDYQYANMNHRYCPNCGRKMEREVTE